MRRTLLAGRTPAQERAIARPCLLAEETMHPRYRRIRRGVSVILTVNSGYE